MNSVSIYAFADEASPNIDKQIAALKRNGLSGLEIRNVDGANVSDISTEKAKEVARKLSNNGLVVWSVGSPIGKIMIDEDFDSHMEKLKHTIQVAHALDCQRIRIFSFYLGAKKAEAYTNEIIERLGRMCELAAYEGVRLYHENEKGIYGDLPERCLTLHRALPELRGIFDPANFVQCGVDTIKAWGMLKGYISYMHIKDARADGFIVPAGAGNGHVAEIAADYLALGESAFTIEPHLTFFTGLEQLEPSDEQSQIGYYRYPSSDAAFDAGCNAFKTICKMETVG